MIASTRRRSVDAGNRLERIDVAPSWFSQYGPEDSDDRSTSQSGARHVDRGPFATNAEAARNCTASRRATGLIIAAAPELSTVFAAHGIVPVPHGTPEPGEPVHASCSASRWACSSDASAVARWWRM